MKRALLLALVLVVVGGIIYLLILGDRSTENNQQASCDTSLWAHVYHGSFPSAEDRLQVVNPCITVSGTIVSARAERDGDWHVLLDLDPEFSSLLNAANFKDQQGFLVLEPMCSNPVTQRDTLEEGVCNDFSQSIFTTDLIGQKVAVTGAHVIDIHHGWAEIHPVTSIARAR